jgi:integrase
VPMPGFVRDALLNKPRDERTPYVFCTGNATPFIPRNISRHFKKALKKAGLPSTTRIHDCRHFFVSYLLSQNVPPKDVQVLAGHADFGTTMDIYGHLMPGAQKEAARKMEKLFDEENLLLQH